jgi:NAD(P)-dependent dehydrogenase (short-subunit alcohol dehydrogenase family)
MADGESRTPSTALVTGGTDGIGKATAKKLLSHGWDVVIVGRSASRCEATVEELKSTTGNGSIAALVADLAIMDEVGQAADAFLAAHDRLDFLFLNANAITQERVVTSEGFEANFALGYLGRALLTLKLRGLLEGNQGSQIMTVVGLNVQRLDFDDLTMETDFSGRAALARWQWAAQVFAGEFNRRNSVPLNIYIPGLVRTKILANEPQPMRTFVKLMNLVIGIPVDKAADNVFSVMEEVSHSGIRGATYAWKKQRKPLELTEQPGDAERLWELTENLLQEYGSLVRRKDRQ